MDLVGPIHPPSSRGNKYMLTVIDMLTGFSIAAPIKNKNAETICDAYRNHVYCSLGEVVGFLWIMALNLKIKR